ncbi:MAG TPA: hypothetical protein VG365_06655 [Solirubrobacteraceae bacterium]|jgi:MoaA/NifB/PqqE/SkfB family radical SAM enzyme|nr:hypothetical protein [Solirubrobacteraceae bacterium]
MSVPIRQSNRVSSYLLEQKLRRREKFPFVTHVAVLRTWAGARRWLRDRHDESVWREGVFDKALAAIHAAQAQGVRVTTNMTVFTPDSPSTVRQVLDFSTMSCRWIR